MLDPPHWILTTLEGVTWVIAAYMGYRWAREQKLKDRRKVEEFKRSDEGVEKVSAVFFQVIFWSEIGQKGAEYTHWKLGLHDGCTEGPNPSVGTESQHHRALAGGATLSSRFLNTLRRTS